MYKVTALLENPENKGEFVIIGKDVVFNYDEENYGNGTYMWFGDDYYDLRYNRDYHKDAQIQFIYDLCVNRWNGTRGAWILKELKITTEFDDEKE